MTEPGEVEHAYAYFSTYFSHSNDTIQNLLNCLTRSQRFHLIKNLSNVDNPINTFECSNERLEEWKECKVSLSIDETKTFISFITKLYGKEAIGPLVRNGIIPANIKDKTM